MQNQEWAKSNVKFEKLVLHLSSYLIRDEILNFIDSKEV